MRLCQEKILSSRYLNTYLLWKNLLVRTVSWIESVWVPSPLLPFVTFNDFLTFFKMLMIIVDRCYFNNFVLM